jgi:nucleoside-diphosphate-sugar epimerase
MPEKLHSLVPWRDLTRKNILITGGSGFVGSWLLDTFLSAERQYDTFACIFVLTRNANVFRANRPDLAFAHDIRLIEGDLRTFTPPALKFDYLIHAAVEYESPTQDRMATFAANLEGTRRILEIAKSNTAMKILFLSSGAVYGQQPADLPKVPEDFVGTIEPSNGYAQAKRESEALFLQSGLNIVVARLFAFVGPYLPTGKNFAVGNFIRDAASGGPVRIEGDGTPMRSYLYAEDLGFWLWTILINGELGRTYNVGSDQAVSILELAQRVEKVCGVANGITVAQTPVLSEKPKRYVPCIDRVCFELHLRPLISLDEGIMRMFNWYKRHYTSTK